MFPEDSPASRSLLPGSAGARMMTAISGRKWSGLSGKSGLLGLLEKTLLESCGWHSPIFYLSWKPADIGQGYFLYQLVLSEPGTDGTGPLLWATPNTMDHLPQRSPEALMRQAEGSRKGRKRPANLREQVDPATVKAWEEPRIWKTPVASDLAGRKMHVNSRGEPSLSGQVKLFPTPKAHMRGDCPAERRRRSPDLPSAVKMYNTPTAQDAKNSALPRSQINRDSLVGDVMRELFPTPSTGAAMCGGSGSYRQLEKLEEPGVITGDERRNMSAGNGGQLNPEWVEWLMGFPPGWTET